MTEEQIKNTLMSEVENNFALTIGNFDGVHLGHIALLEDFVNCARAANLEAVVLTFRPHPIFVVRPDTTDFLLCEYNNKINLIKSLGIDRVLELSFDEHTQHTSGEDFLANLFSLQKLRMTYLGHDFAIGSQKAVCHSDAKKIASKFGVDILVGEKLELQEDVPSSTQIRKCLKSGEIEKANKLLGRTFELGGEVISGKQLGRKIGFPTVNFLVDPIFVVPDIGVYAAKMKMNGCVYEVALNIGRNPTVDNSQIVKFEAHIMGWDEKFLHKKIHLEIYKKMRDEMRFENIESLTSQIDQDVDNIRKYFLS